MTLRLGWGYGWRLEGWQGLRLGAGRASLQPRSSGEKDMYSLSLLWIERVGDITRKVFFSCFKVLKGFILL